MKCELCGNDDRRSFIVDAYKILCRKCITYQVGLLENELVSHNEHIDAEYTLNFKLSTEQTTLSDQLVKLVLQEGEDVLVYAACGAGKTEIILQLLQLSLEAHLKVAIAIPRRQVVLELYNRLTGYFKNLSIVAVCEGYTDEVDGELVICTTHQLYRYNNYFDLIILDEPDAFPFANNELLASFLDRALRANIVYLTATPDDNLLSLKTIKLFKRFHGHPLLVPDVFINVKFMLYFKLIKYIRENSNLLIFTPSIKMAERLSKLLRIPCIHSKSGNRDSVIAAFSSKQIKTLITTTILERGVTFEGVNVCVLFADSEMFSKASLIQIAGRVGRSAQHPNGVGLFLCNRKSRKVNECIKTLNMMNA